MNWDVYSKLLLKECPQDFVTYCVPGARFVRMRESQFQTRARSHYKAREMRGDAIIEAEYQGQHFLIHIEWQSSRDEDMATRLLGYCYEAIRLHKLPVLSIVIYLQEVSDIPCGPIDQRIPTGRRILWFDFDSLEVCNQHVEAFRQLDLDAFYVLMPLCANGASRVTLDEVLERLEKHNKKELLAIARFFAGKVFVSKDDCYWLERRFAMLRDFLQDSWTFQQTLEEGRAEGRAEGNLYTTRQNIEAFMEVRFPNLFTWVKEQVEQVSDINRLQHILLALYAANTPEEIRSAFSA